MRDRRAADGLEGYMLPGLPRGRARLFADLENCTVANETGIWTIVLKAIVQGGVFWISPTGKVHTDPRAARKTLSRDGR